MHSLHDSPGIKFSHALVTLTLAIGVFVSGCSTWSTIKESPDSIGEPSAFGKEWDNSVGKMGVAAIVPPSEDIRVGDIYVYGFNPDFPVANGNNPRFGGLSISPRWASLDLLKELEQEYKLRPAWPKTPDTYFQIADDPGNREWLEPRTPENQSIFAEDSVTDRLRIMGIPEFSSITLTDGDLNAIVPTAAINLVFGSAWNDDKAITIRLNATETYSLGLQKVIEAALEYNAQGSALKAPYRNHLHLVSDPLSNAVWVRILSDVIYVRSIDIIIQSQAAFKPDEEVNANEFVAEIEETAAVIEEESTDTAEDDEMRDTKAQTVSEVLPDHSLDPAYTAFVRANAINEILIESDVDDLPGGYLRLISVTDDSVTVRRVWQRGLAIGARGLTLKVDKATGQIMRSSNMGRMLRLPPTPPTPTSE
ncbi:MAG: hypothetical protein ACO2Y9_11885 [Pseudohongiellaceae bacterium]